MEPELLLNTLFRWIHVGTAIVLLGGSVFLRFVVLPAAEKLSPESHDHLRTHLRATWKKFVHVGIALLLLSGFYNYLIVQLPAHKGDSLYHAFVGTKILIALGVFFVASVLVGRSAKFDKWRQNPRTWLLVVVALASVVVAISGFVKVRGIPAKPPAETTQP